MASRSLSSSSTIASGSNVGSSSSTLNNNGGNAGDVSVQILDRATVFPSWKDLDASDAVECYVLARKAKLKKNIQTHSDEHLWIRKTALAFRYKPSRSHFIERLEKNKQAFAITLEYGPQRTGSTLSSEAMPIIHNMEEEEVSWENEAKIYYSNTNLSSGSWTEAYYMAHITGAVLSDVMEFILNYPNQHSRYQPFSVIESSTERQVLRSSNSDDFVWNVMDYMSQRYVNIRPVLAPQRHTVRFHVEDPSRDITKFSSSSKVNGTYIANLAAHFYQNFYDCATAIGTGDYSLFTSAPTSSPTNLFTSTPSTSPTSVASPSSIPTLSNSTTNETNLTNSDNDVHNINNTTNTTKNQSQDSFSNQDEGAKNGMNMTNSTKDEKYYDEGDHGNRLAERVTETIIPSTSPTVQNLNSNIPTAELKDGGAENKAKKAMNAADKAEKAANEAKEAATSPEDSAAANAAAEAAHAAKEAADATLTAASKAAMDSLLHGDGATMTSILSTCFSDPKYHIGQANNNDDDDDDDDDADKSTFVYLYIDGATYYRLNITEPYWDVLHSTQAIATPETPSIAKASFFEWLLVLIIIGGFLFGILVMLHFTGVVSIDPRLSFRWFFHPTKPDHNIITPMIPLNNLKNKCEVVSTTDDDEDLFHDEEFINGSNNDNDDGNLRSRRIRQFEMVSKSSISVSVDDSSFSTVSRDPSLVDRPHSKSSTKVALPTSPFGDVEEITPEPVDYLSD